MTFLSPLLLLALVPVGALALGYVVAQRRRRRYAVRFATLPMIDRLVPQQPKWRRHIPTSLLLLALAGLSLAAARPQVDLQVPYEQATVIVAIDTSRSMEADDVKPSRLEAAKAAATDFVGDLPDGFNVGLIQFGGAATVVGPASQDHADIERRIAALTTTGGGTAIGESMFAAIDEIARLGAESAEAASNLSVPARMVLLSDGDNSAGRTPEDAAQAARQAGLPVSTIAYGTDGGSTSIGGSRQVAPVDENTLREVAGVTGGQFYEATSSDQLSSVYDDIGSSIGRHTETVDVAPYLALAGLVLAGVAVGLSLFWFSRLI